MRDSASCCTILHSPGTAWINSRRASFLALFLPLAFASALVFGPPRPAAGQTGDGQWKLAIGYSGNGTYSLPTTSGNKITVNAFSPAATPFSLSPVLNTPTSTTTGVSPHR